MDFKAGIGSLACRLCAASFQMPIHHLSEPIDVFSEWLDDCEAAQHGRPPNASSSSLSSSALLSAPRNQYDYESDDDSEGDLPEASGLHNKPAAATTATTTTAASTDDKADARPSFTDLGLDDSDDDDDDDDSDDE